MIYVILLLIGLVAIFWPRIVRWITERRMDYRHFITHMKVSALKTLHEIGLI